MRQEFINRVIYLIRCNFSISEVADLFYIDYRNMCAYMAGRKKFPLDLAFSILEYLDCRTVIFQSK